MVAWSRLTLLSVLATLALVVGFVVPVPEEARAASDETDPGVVDVTALPGLPAGTVPLVDPVMPEGSMGDPGPVPGASVSDQTEAPAQSSPELGDGSVDTSGLTVKSRTETTTTFTRAVTRR